MRAWQRLGEKERPTNKAADPSAMIGHMFHAFALHAKYWRAVGSRKKGVCQFSLAGAPYPDWYVTIDEQGGRVATGLHHIRTRAGARTRETSPRSCEAKEAPSSSTKVESASTEIST